MRVPATSDQSPPPAKLPSEVATPRQPSAAPTVAESVMSPRQRPRPGANRRQRPRRSPSPGCRIGRLGPGRTCNRADRAPRRRRRTPIEAEQRLVPPNMKPMPAAIGQESLRRRSSRGLSRAPSVRNRYDSTRPSIYSSVFAAGHVACGSAAAVGGDPPSPRANEMGLFRLTSIQEWLQSFAARPSRRSFVVRPSRLPAQARRLHHKRLFGNRFALPCRKPSLSRPPLPSAAELHRRTSPTCSATCWRRWRGRPFGRRIPKKPKPPTADASWSPSAEADTGSWAADWCQTSVGMAEPVEPGPAHRAGRICRPDRLGRRGGTGRTVEPVDKMGRSRAS